MRRNQRQRTIHGRSHSEGRGAEERARSSDDARPPLRRPERVVQRSNYRPESDFGRRSNAFSDPRTDDHRQHPQRQHSQGRRANSQQAASPSCGRASSSGQLSDCGSRSNARLVRTRPHAHARSRSRGDSVTNRSGQRRDYMACCVTREREGSIDRGPKLAAPDPPPPLQTHDSYGPPSPIPFRGVWARNSRIAGIFGPFL